MTIKEYAESIPVTIVEPNDAFKWVFLNGQYYVNQKHEHEFKHRFLELIQQYEQ